MANLAISIKGDNKIVHFIWNCEQSGNNFIGSNRKAMGLKLHLFDLKWTNDMIGVTNDGYDKDMNEINEALTFEGFVITDKSDIGKAVKSLIALKYSLEDELKLHGEHADHGNSNDDVKAEWNEYRKYVNDIKSRARDFKNKHLSEIINPQGLQYQGGHKMKKLLLSLALILCITSTSNAVVTNYSKYTCLTGGTADCLDSQDGTNLLENDRAMVDVSDVLYYCRINASSGAAESSPNIISPDTNAGSKRWICAKTDAANMLTGIAPIANGGTGRATSTTAYGLIAAGTTATGALQTIATGNSGDVLISGGSSALPSFSTTAWTTPTYSSGNFTGNGSMTWTVESGDVGTYAYILFGKTMTVAFALNTTSVGGTPSGYLQIAIPASKTATKAINTCIYYLDNNVRGVGFASIPAGGTMILLAKPDVSNWTASTNQTYVFGELTFEVN